MILTDVIINTCFSSEAVAGSLSAIIAPFETLPLFEMVFPDIVAEVVVVFATYSVLLPLAVEVVVFVWVYATDTVAPLTPLAPALPLTVTVPITGALNTLLTVFFA